MKNQKKRYLAPTLVAHGAAVAKTLGQCGYEAEFINFWIPQSA